MDKIIRIRKLTKDIPAEAKALCDMMLKELENSNRPVLEAVKCSLDNSLYNPKVGYLTPGSKRVRTELNVSSVQKMARVVDATRWSSPAFECAAREMLKFQGHLSHGVGMAVHDAGDYKCNELAPGVVFALAGVLQQFDGLGDKLAVRLHPPDRAGLGERADDLAKICHVRPVQNGFAQHRRLDRGLPAVVRRQTFADEDQVGQLG